MGFLDFLKKAGSAINQGLQKTKLVSTLAPLLPAYGSEIATMAKNAGYIKGGRVLRKSAIGMKKGGKVKKAKMLKKPKKAKKMK